MSDGGVRSPAPPGKESDAGDVKAFACIAVDGWEFKDSLRVSMVAVVLAVDGARVEVEGGRQSAVMGEMLGLRFIFIFQVRLWSCSRPRLDANAARERRRTGSSASMALETVGLKRGICSRTGSGR